MGARIIDTAETAVATPLKFSKIKNSIKNNRLFFLHCVVSKPCKKSTECIIIKKIYYLAHNIKFKKQIDNIVDLFVLTTFIYICVCIYIPLLINVYRVNQIQ